MDGHNTCPAACHCSLPTTCWGRGHLLSAALWLASHASQASSCRGLYPLHHRSGEKPSAKIALTHPQSKPKNTICHRSHIIITTAEKAPTGKLTSQWDPSGHAECRLHGEQLLQHRRLVDYGLWNQAKKVLNESRKGERESEQHNQSNHHSLTPYTPVCGAPHAATIAQQCERQRGTE